MNLDDTSPAETSIGGDELRDLQRRRGHPLVELVLRIARRVSSPGVLFLTAGIGGVLVVLLTLAAGSIYDAVEDGDGVSTFDRPVLQQVLGWRSPDLDRYLTWFTHLGGPLGMTIIATAVTGLMMLRWRSRTPLLLMVITVAGSLLMTMVGKAIIGRVRPAQVDAVPPYETSPSFPSGHALNSTAIAGIVAYLVVIHLQRRLAKVLTITLAGLWAVSIGLSRVFLGHHWLTDVMVGWVLGLAWLGVVVTAHRMYLTVYVARGGDRPPGDAAATG